MIRFFLLIFVVSAGVMPDRQEKTLLPDPPLETILSAKAYQKYQQKENYKDRVDLFRETLSDQADALHNEIKDKHLEGAGEVLGKMRALANYAKQEPTRQSASVKDLRSRQVIKLEVRIRRLTDTLHDYKLSVPLEYRDQFDQTTADLETLRDQLLKGIFSQAAPEIQLPSLS
jgi:hypothetical protein